MPTVSGPAKGKNLFVVYDWALFLRSALGYQNSATA
jgi:hypothetical protein